MRVRKTTDEPGREPARVVAHRGELAAASAAWPAFVGAASRPCARCGREPSKSTVTGNARSTSTWRPSCSAAGRGRDDDVVGDRAARARAVEERADGVRLGAHCVAGAVDDERDLGAGGRQQPGDRPATAEDGGDHEQGDRRAPGARAGRPVRRRRMPRRGRGVLQELGDRRERLRAGERQPGGGVVGLGPRRRRCRARPRPRPGRRHDRLGLGDDRRLDLGVGVEQRFDRRQVVDVGGQRQPGGRVVGLGRGRATVRPPLRARRGRRCRRGRRPASPPRATSRSRAARAGPGRGATPPGRAARRARATGRSCARRARAAPSGDAEVDPHDGPTVRRTMSCSAMDQRPCSARCRVACARRHLRASTRFRRRNVTVVNPAPCGNDPPAGPAIVAGQRGVPEHRARRCRGSRRQPRRPGDRRRRRGPHRRRRPARVGSAGRGAAPARGTARRSRPARGRAGRRAAAARTSSAFLNVTMPLNDRYAPSSSARRASSGPPVKQWNTVRRRHARVVEDAERVVPRVARVDHERAVEVGGRAGPGHGTRPPARRSASARSGGRSPLSPIADHDVGAVARERGQRVPLARPARDASWGCRPTVARTSGWRAAQLDRPPRRLQVGPDADQRLDPRLPGLGATVVVGRPPLPPSPGGSGCRPSGDGCRSRSRPGVDPGEERARPCRAGAPAGRPPHAGRLREPLAPRGCRRGRAGATARATPRGISGDASSATMRSASRQSPSTAATAAASPALLSAHGCWSSMYEFVARMRSHTAPKPLE